MMLNGDIRDTAYCENDGELKGTLLDIRFGALNNVSVINHEVRDEGQQYLHSASSEHTSHEDKITLQNRVSCTNDHDRDKIISIFINI
jgi:hypothetical protein